MTPEFKEYWHDRYPNMPTPDGLEQAVFQDMMEDESWAAWQAALEAVRGEIKERIAPLRKTVDVYAHCEANGLADVLGIINRHLGGE